MACFHPLTGFRGTAINPRTGKVAVHINKKSLAGDIQNPIKIPCGHCIGCRLDRSLHWAMRCMCEAKLHKENSFITLTYDNENLKKSSEIRSLNKKDFDKFLAKLREGIRYHYGKEIRFYACGEYGDLYGRPHYHAAIFGYAFPDRTYLKTINGVRLYTSAFLSKYWKSGFSTVGDLTMESAAYVARYVTKKIYGPSADCRYKGRTPEYTQMSRRPGVGRRYYETYKESIYAIDGVMVKPGKVIKPGRYFDSIYDTTNQKELEEIKKKRLEKVNEDDNTFQRLKVKEQIKQHQFKKLKRSYENG